MYIYIYIVRLAENFILVICLVFLPSLNKTQIKLLDLTFWRSGCLWTVVGYKGFDCNGVLFKMIKKTKLWKHLEIETEG